MALEFFGKDDESGADNCPAVFVEEETGDFLLQGWTVTDPDTLSAHRRAQPDRGQRVGGQAPGPDAGDPIGGG
jgi:hypothetical protein